MSNSGTFPVSQVVDEHPSKPGRSVAIVNPVASSGAAAKRWDMIKDAVAVHFPELEGSAREVPLS